MDREQIEALRQLEGALSNTRDKFTRPWTTRLREFVRDCAELELEVNHLIQQNAEPPLAP